MTKPTHAELARTLFAARSWGTLSTLAIEPTGYPYGSVVDYVLDPHGSLILLTSTLAVHTKNWLRDPRCSLTVWEEDTEGSHGSSVVRGRATVLATAQKLEEDTVLTTARELYLVRHPSASQYVDFGDFSFWQLRVESVRWIGGFGRMSWVTGAAWSGAESDPIAPAAQEIVDHVNDDHLDTLALYCQAFADITAQSPRMSSVDRYGFDILLTEPPHRVRIAFPAPAKTPGQVRASMVKLANEAREKLGVGAPK